MSTLCSTFSFTSNSACRTILTSQSFHTVLKLLPSSAQAQTSARLSWYYCQSQTDPDPTRKVCLSFYTLQAKLLNAGSDATYSEFGGLPHSAGKLFLPETNFRCSVITKLKFRVWLEPPRINTSGENCRYVVGWAYMPTPAWNRVKHYLIN